jgi:N-acyl-D-amino-acid deacylase
MFDYLIRNGRIVDGTGDPATVSDIAIQGGKIAAIGKLSGSTATETIDARGKIVTPGFIDIHTHYDGQVTWDDKVDPSFSHGVTTIVMGNCGVGFAPVRAGEHQKLIELMEGVEDIPGSVLSEGIKWNWETFPEYLDSLATRKWSMDVAAQVPHGAVRAYVMGERGYRNEDATADDIARMGALVAEAVDAGAVGFSTSRIAVHTALNGDPVPGTFALQDELFGIGRALKGKRVVFEVVPGGLEGKDPFSHDAAERIDPATGQRARVEASLEHELKWMAQLSREAQLPVTFLFSQSYRQPERHDKVFAITEAENANGAHLKPQINVRPVGLISSFQTYHLFQRRPSYLAIAGLPFEQRLRELRRPEVKNTILSEQDAPSKATATFNDTLHLFLAGVIQHTFPMGNPLDFEPTADKSVVERAKILGVRPESHIYDLMLEHDGKGMMFSALSNYVDRNFDVLRTLMLHPDAIIGGSDGGAHVRYICDAALPSYALIHWVRDRSRGERIPLETMVKRITSDAARLYGLDDRGVIAVGRRADLNVIDLERLDLGQPYPTNDLPAQGTRLLQNSRGYEATFVNGVCTRRNDQDTRARPGRLVRGASAVRRPGN